MELLHKQGHRPTAIGRKLGRAKSTVSRELKHREAGVPYAAAQCRGRWSWTFSPETANPDPNGIQTTGIQYRRDGQQGAKIHYYSHQGAGFQRGER